MASIHDKLGKVRKPRVHLTYQVETEGSVVEQELPFVVGVMGEFVGDATGTVKPLKERRFVTIDQDNFDEVMARMAPSLSLQVKNTLAEEGGTLPVTLNFTSMGDFEPANVVGQVEPLRELLEIRNKLRDLMTKIDRSDDLELLLEKILQSPDQLKALSGQLGVAGDSEQRKED